MQGEFFPGGGGAFRITCQTHHWISASSPCFSNFCSLNYESPLLGHETSITCDKERTGQSAHHPLSRRVPLGGKMALHPPSSPSTQTTCMPAQCIPGGSDQLVETQKDSEQEGGHSAVNEAAPRRSVSCSHLSGFPSLWVKYHLKQVSLNCPDGWSITKSMCPCGCCPLSWVLAMGLTVVTGELSSSEYCEGTWCPSYTPGDEVTCGVASPRAGWDTKASNTLDCSLLTLLPVSLFAQHSSIIFSLFFFPLNVRVQTIQVMWVLLINIFLPCLLKLPLTHTESPI